ncbi:MAG TPA: glycosyltransferase family 4 protein, partial [Candidatus Limnocylindrales bacterium]|nr:glycosyltransferase family 4 protein [Candidatus Limnocylindrales bacterium]
MKVFLVSKAIYPERGGVELHVYRIAEGLLAMGHQVWALVEGKQQAETRSNGLRVVSSVSSGEFSRLLENHKPDVVHAHGARNVFAARALLAARRAGIRTVFTPHCFYPAQDL